MKTTALLCDFPGCKITQPGPDVSGWFGVTVGKIYGPSDIRKDLCPHHGRQMINLLTDSQVATTKETDHDNTGPTG